MPIQFSRLPVIRTVCLYWNNHQQSKELDLAIQTFEKPHPSSDLTHKTIALLTRTQDNPALKTKTGKLERAYFAFLKATGKPLPSDYSTLENKKLIDVFLKIGISKDFLVNNPDFLSNACTCFWNHYFPFLQIPIEMRGQELYIPIETKENSGTYALIPWAQMKRFNLENFRVTYQGFAIGHPDASAHLAPLKKVDASGKQAIQFVTACPTTRRLPSPASFADSGHSFIHLIRDNQVYSVGFYPRKIADLGMRLFKTVLGVYRNHDSNVSRILAGQVIPLIKQYVFSKDLLNQPCLLSIVQNMHLILPALEKKGWTYTPVSLEAIDQAMLNRNEPEMDRILIELNRIRDLIGTEEIRVTLPPLEAKDKVGFMIARFENAQGKHPYHTLTSNCTAASLREESFATVFLGATLDKAPPIQIYPSQVDIRNHKFQCIDRVRDVFERVVVHFFAALPLTGPILGTGSTHPTAKHTQPPTLIPRVLSATAFATHQLLTAPFTKRSLFPAGGILNQNVPIQKPGFWARLRYSFQRHRLLAPIGNA